MKKINLSPVFSDELNQALRKMYDKASTCKDGLLTPVAIDRGFNLLKRLNYPQALLATLPPEYSGLAFPCANPLPRIIALAPHSILDLGCGSALDIFLCSRSLPDLKRAAGLDASPKLLAKGEKLLELFPQAAEKITLFKGDINNLDSYKDYPFKNSELILMNGSFNLVYDKNRFFAALPPLLTRNGKLLIYDFLLTEDLPPGFADEVDNWLWNIGGALHAVELEKIVAGAGLKILEINEIERIDPVARCEIVISV